MRATVGRLLAIMVLIVPLFIATLLRHQSTNNTYIVQASSLDKAQAAVEAVDGERISDLAIINAVSAQLTPAAAAELEARGYVVTYDAPVYKAGDDDHETDTEGYTLYPAAATGVNTLHESKVQTPKSECKAEGTNNWRVNRYNDHEERELQGYGVTVAVVDTGLNRMASSGDWKRNGSTGELFAENSGRCVVYRDFLPRTSANGNSGSAAYNSVDQHGHGTHIVTTIADNYEVELSSNSNATPTGVAPQVNLVVARALDKNGAGSYSTVIQAIDWIVQNKDRYNIRVLNLSLYAPVQGPYRTDPINQAVMRAWDAGIVVVVAAGNEGPTPQSITVPGNVPYVITVGAVQSGRYTDSGYDEVANYSSRGPTEMGFVKPDIVVPASRTIAAIPQGSQLSNTIDELREDYSCPGSDPNGDHPSYCYHDSTPIDVKIGSLKDNYKRYQLSGTSMAAAEVSGVVALMLQKSPNLTNDQVKYRLMRTARSAVDPQTNEPIYSVWEQGAGLVDARDAIHSSATNVANYGLDIERDLNPNATDFFRGPTDYDPNTGEYLLIHPETHAVLDVWNGSGFIWNGSGFIWNGSGFIWNGSGFIWNGSGFIWNGSGFIWNGSTAGRGSSSSIASEMLLVDN